MLDVGQPVRRKPANCYKGDTPCRFPNVIGRICVVEYSKQTGYTYEAEFGDCLCTMKPDDVEPA